jgi:NAD(P)-dependent dehydrogenase (short-subunit alcohol dehydrogenase family)
MCLLPLVVKRHGSIIAGRRLPTGHITERLCPMRDLAGRVALVTGAGGGVGWALAQQLAAAGAQVVAGYRSSPPPTGGHLAIVPLHLDVTDRESVRRAAEYIEHRLGKLHVLCNSAAVNLLGHMDLATHEDWDWILGVNLYGVINTLVGFLPLIKAHGEGGQIINIASMGSFVTGPNSGIYNTSKFAVRGLSESLRYTLAAHGIGVTLVCPGLIRTRIFESPLRRPAGFARSGFKFDAQSLARLESIHAAGMAPEEIARKTLEGIRENRFYVFTHPEFKAELRELHREIESDFIVQESVAPERRAVEKLRRDAQRLAKKALAQL